MVALSLGLLMATTSISVSFCSKTTRNISRPMRPKPLIPMRAAIGVRLEFIFIVMYIIAYFYCAVYGGAILGLCLNLLKVFESWGKIGYKCRR